MPTDANLNCVVAALLGSEAEGGQRRLRAVEKSPGIVAARGMLQAGDMSGFYFALVYPLDETVDALLANEFPHSPELQFLFKEYSFVENHFLKVIEQREGPVCGFDKCQTVLAGLLDFLKTGKPLAYNFEQEYTFHLPRVVFRTHTEVVSYFDALHHLYYGRAEPFVRAWQALPAADTGKQRD